MRRLAAEILPERRSGTLRWAAAAALVAAVALAWYLAPLAAWLAALRSWIVGLGVAGAAVFVVIYVIGAVILAPEALLTVLGGFAYGFWALPLVLVAATIGAGCAFLIARRLGRDKVQRLLGRHRNIAALDTAVAEDGWKIVLLLRLSPLIPFNLQNYVFGVTAIPFAHFIAATFTGIIPGTALYVYLGALGQETGGGPAKWALFALGLVATLAVALLIARKAKAKLSAAGVATGP